MPTVIAIFAGEEFPRHLIDPGYGHNEESKTSGYRAALNLSTPPDTLRESRRISRGKRNMTM